MRKNLLLILFLILAAILIAGLYLNRAYAHIYDFIGEKNLTPPPMAETVTFSSNLPDPKPLVRYAAIGDSLTAGTGSNDVRSSFPYLLAQKISQSGPVELANFGVPGAEAEDVIKYQLAKVMAFDPDYVTVLIGVNDIHNQTGISNYKIGLVKILNELKEKTRAKIVVINLPFIGTKDLFLPPYYFYFQKQTEEFNRVIFQIAGRKPFVLFDLYTPTAPEAVKNINYYAEDRFHPGPDGYRLWADLIYADPNCRPN